MFLILELPGALNEFLFLSTFFNVLCAVAHHPPPPKEFQSLVQQLKGGGSPSPEGLLFTSDHDLIIMLSVLGVEEQLGNQKPLAQLSKS